MLQEVKTMSDVRFFPLSRHRGSFHYDRALGQIMVNLLNTLPIKN